MKKSLLIAISVSSLLFLRPLQCVALEIRPLPIPFHPDYFKMPGLFFLENSFNRQMAASPDIMVWILYPDMNQFQRN